MAPSSNPRMPFIGAFCLGEWLRVEPRRRERITLPYGKLREKSRSAAIEVI